MSLEFSDRFTINLLIEIDYGMKNYSMSMCIDFIEKIKDFAASMRECLPTTNYYGYKVIDGETWGYYRPNLRKKNHTFIIRINKTFDVVFERLLYSTMDIDGILKNDGVVRDRDNKHKYCSISNRNPYTRHIYESMRRRKERLNRLRLERLEREERYLQMKKRLGNW